jgi:ArsR family transcriptional regulator
MDNTTLPIERLSKLLKILSEPNRLKILASMGLECVPVSAIIAKTGLSQTNVSFHLRVMREAGIVKGERNGAFVFYCLYDYTILDLLKRLAEWNDLTIEKAS